MVSVNLLLILYSVSVITSSRILPSLGLKNTLNLHRLLRKKASQPVTHKAAKIPSMTRLHILTWSEGIACPHRMRATHMKIMHPNKKKSTMYKYLRYC